MPPKKIQKQKAPSETSDPLCLEHWSDEDDKYRTQLFSLHKYEKLLVLSQDPNDDRDEVKTKWSAKWPSDVGCVSSNLVLLFGWDKSTKKWKKVPAASQCTSECLSFGCYYSQGVEDDDFDEYLGWRQYFNPPLKRLVNGKEKPQPPFRVVVVPSSALCCFLPFSSAIRKE